MRINRFIALATGLSRRAADREVAAGQVRINQQPATAGSQVTNVDSVTLNGKQLALPRTVTIMLNKPVGYVVSRQGQGNPTVYDLLPAKFRSLKPIGRLDKDSSGLLLLTNDGELAHELTHPSRQKEKVYEITLDRALKPEDKAKVERGIQLEDGLSKLTVIPGAHSAIHSEAAGSHPIPAANDGISHAITDGRHWTIKMTEGRNRQIRRTFAALGYAVQRLHRTDFGPYQLQSVRQGKIRLVKVN